jgi:hypothetical protein
MTDELWRDLEIGGLYAEADLAEAEGEHELAKRFRAEADRLAVDVPDGSTDDGPPPARQVWHQ